MNKIKMRIFWRTVSFALLVLPFATLASPNYYCSSINYREYQSLEKIEEAEQADKIEAYLQKTVPGLYSIPVTYREVIDTLISEGYQVYLTGGVVRDLLSLSSASPYDVDLDYSGTADELAAILDKKGWLYTRFPNQSLITIGDHREGSIDAMPINNEKKTYEHSLEFTINNIFYHCNNRTFTASSRVGLEDLRSDRINIIAENWNNWLYQPKGHRYYKIFRFWKMVGKGYVYSTKLAEFFRTETDKVQLEDHESFLDEMVNYLARHMYSYDVIYRGAISIMGYTWVHENFTPLKEKATDLQKKFETDKDQYTFNLSVKPLFLREAHLE